jgi:hypothetical protein
VNITQALQHLSGKRVTSATAAEYTFHLGFDGGAALTIECLWRLVRDGVVVLASRDHGQQFGLQAPVDARGQFEAWVANLVVSTATVSTGGPTDLAIVFTTGLRLDCIVDSSGYESWSLSCPTPTFTAFGGGQISRAS